MRGRYYFFNRYHFYNRFITNSFTNSFIVGSNIETRVTDNEETETADNRAVEIGDYVAVFS